MNEMLLNLLTALWLGILTSISPCPLTTNIAASTYIGKKIGDTRSVILSGLLYTAGRVIVYILIGTALLKGILSISSLSIFLQEYMNKILGPILIITGMFLLELLSFNLNGFEIKEGFKEKMEEKGLIGSFLMGGIFALSFCPVSAALFFGSLIPLALKTKSLIIMPLLYGIGTGLPVILFALVIGFSAKSLGKIFNSISLFETKARMVTGIVFILSGIYLVFKYIFELI